MKNATMIRLKRKETRKTVGWYQRIQRVPRPMYDFSVAVLTLRNGFDQPVGYFSCFFNFWSNHSDFLH